MENPELKFGIAVVFSSCMRFDKVTFVLLMLVGRTEVTLFWKTLLGSLTNLFFISSVVEFQNGSDGCFTLRVALLIVLLKIFINGSINLFG